MTDNTKYTTKLLNELGIYYCEAKVTKLSCKIKISNNNIPNISNLLEIINKLVASQCNMYWDEDHSKLFKLIRLDDSNMILTCQTLDDLHFFINNVRHDMINFVQAIQGSECDLLKTYVAAPMLKLTQKLDMNDIVKIL